MVEQVTWGREKKLPWGVSECAYSAIDANQTYQYHAFGVRALALNAGLNEGDVIAPYATMLSLQVDLASRARQSQAVCSPSASTVRWACTKPSTSRVTANAASAAC